MGFHRLNIDGASIKALEESRCIREGVLNNVRFLQVCSDDAGVTWCTVLHRAKRMVARHNLPTLAACAPLIQVVRNSSACDSQRYIFLSFPDVPAPQGILYLCPIREPDTVTIATPPIRIAK